MNKEPPQGGQQSVEETLRIAKKYLLGEIFCKPEDAATYAIMAIDRVLNSNALALVEKIFFLSDRVEMVANYGNILDDPKGELLKITTEIKALREAE